jgi:hypothetical protein
MFGVQRRVEAVEPDSVALGVLTTALAFTRLDLRAGRPRAAPVVRFLGPALGDVVDAMARASTSTSRGTTAMAGATVYVSDSEHSPNRLTATTYDQSPARAVARATWAAVDAGFAASVPTLLLWQY